MKNPKSNVKKYIIVVVVLICVIVSGYYVKNTFLNSSSNNDTSKKNNNLSEYESYAVNIINDYHSFLEYYSTISNDDWANSNVKDIEINSLYYIIPKAKDQFSLIINYDFNIGDDSYKDFGIVIGGANHEFNLLGKDEIQRSFKNFKTSSQAKSIAYVTTKQIIQENNLEDGVEYGKYDKDSIIKIEKEVNKRITEKEQNKKYKRFAKMYKDVIKKEIEDNTKDFYINFYYPEVLEGMTEKEISDLISGFDPPGLKVDLESLLNYIEKNKEDESLALNTFQYDDIKICDKSNTQAIIYPKVPYTKNNFDIEVKLDCNFNIN